MSIPINYNVYSICYTNKREIVFFITICICFSSNTIQEISDILKENNKEYSSIDDVIEKLYTRPIKYYRLSAIARFKEAYKLVIEKEHKSKFKALSLASELFSTLNLHPAIITACKSLDELDIYLACLEDNSLNEFPFFEIKYEIAPKVQKQENSF